MHLSRPMGPRHRFPAASSRYRRSVREHILVVGGIAGLTLAAMADLDGLGVGQRIRAASTTAERWRVLGEA